MSTTRMIARLALVAAALSTAGVATAAVTLPSKANHHAVTATANVTTGSSNGQSDDVHPASTPSPNEHAAFGQCVAANAQTASDNGGKGWNPTVGCDKPNAPQNGTNASSNASASTGLTNADAHANSHASAGLQKASTASATGEAHAH
jgi:hypothetical protein